MHVSCNLPICSSRKRRGSAQYHFCDAMRDDELCDRDFPTENILQLGCCMRRAVVRQIAGRSHSDRSSQKLSLTQLSLAQLLRFALRQPCDSPAHAKPSCHAKVRAFKCCILLRQECILCIEVVKATSRDGKNFPCRSSRRRSFMATPYTAGDLRLLLQNLSQSAVSHARRNGTTYCTVTSSLYIALSSRFYDSKIYPAQSSTVVELTYGAFDWAHPEEGLLRLRFRMTRSIRLSYIRMSHPSSSQKNAYEFG